MTDLLGQLYRLQSRIRFVQEREKKRDTVPEDLIEVDPSHAGGVAELVAPLSFAAIAAGADGLIVEVHPDPANALSDGDQSLSFEGFRAMMHRLGAFAEAAERSLGSTTGLGAAGVAA